MSIDEIRDMGEESGREEMADEAPFHDIDATYRDLIHRGRGRAQGMYGLRGRHAREFAQYWAEGYKANCSLYRYVGCAEEATT